MNASLSFAAEAMQGTLTGADCEFSGVSTDTRTLDRGSLFVALKGPNFDGGDYLDAAAAGGAVAAVVSERRDVDLPQIEVADTRDALGQLGRAWRNEQSATVIGITGSNGKTTLKELTRAILSRSGTTLATHGNLNNDIGVPLMLCRIESGHRYAVIEMGANHAGEIAYLTSLASPDVVALTNAGPAHLEGFGSIEGVSRAKGEILAGVPRPSAAVLNRDDQYFDYWQEQAHDVRVVSFGLDTAAEVRATDIVLESSGAAFTLVMPGAALPVRSALTGEHNVRNACAAAAIALALDIAPEDIAAGIASVRPVAGRLAGLEGRNGTTVFDDSYNANPESVAAAAGFLASLGGETCLILGDMGELGDEARALHHATGVAIREAGVDRLLATGPLCRAAVEGFGNNGEWFDSKGELLTRAEQLLAPGHRFLVKGSRLAAMETIVDGLTTEPATVREVQ